MVLIKTHKSLIALNPALILSVSLLTDYSDTPNDYIRIVLANSDVMIVTAHDVDLCLSIGSGQYFKLPAEGKDLNDVFLDLTGHTIA